MTEIRSALFGWFLAALSVIGFASTFVVGGELAAERAISPSVLALLRFVVAGGTMLAVGMCVPSLRARLFAPTRHDWLRLLWLGPIGTAFMAWCVFRGCSLVPVANASMADALTPLGIFAVSLLVTRQATILQIAGLALGFAGALLTIGVVDAGGLNVSAYGIGDFAILMSACFWGIYTALGKGDVERIGAYAFSTWTMLLGAVLLLAAIALASLFREQLSGVAGCFGAVRALFPGLAQGIGRTWPQDLHSLKLVAFLGVFCTLMPFLTWNAAQKHLPLSVLAMTAYFTPVVALLIDLFARSNSVTPLQWAGTLLICLSAVVEVGRNGR